MVTAVLHPPFLFIGACMKEHEAAFRAHLPQAYGRTSGDFFARAGS